MRGQEVPLDRCPKTCLNAVIIVSGRDRPGLILSLPRP